MIKLSQSESPFINMLEAMHVKHTRLYSNKYYNEHPYKNNMYGLYKMLSDYKIECEGIRISEEDKFSILPELDVPFIAYTGNDFITVTNNTSERIEYLWNGNKISITPKKFIELWSGVALIAETNLESQEPYYKIHRKSELLAFGKKLFLVCLFISILFVTWQYNKLYNSIGIILSLLINFMGLLVCYMLIQKQIHVNSKYADKLCSLLLKKGNCNSILESEAAKIYSFSWSEIGCGYFLSNVLLISLAPFLFQSIALINICVLPFSIWSVWYQYKKVKQWCPLCLITQVILWLFFICDISFGLIPQSGYKIENILITGCIYAMFVLFINLYISQISDTSTIEQIKQEHNKIKANDAVFKLLLKTRQKYDVDRLTSSILWGNLEAKNLLTIVTNPHCNPCAIMHTRLINLLEKSNNNYCIQYILTSFNAELEESSKLFIAMYKCNDNVSFLKFLDDWYKYGKNNIKKYYKKYPFDDKDRILLEEFYKHKKWLKLSKISATPTILFNGYELPEEYNVEDLIYFSNIEI